MPSDWFPTSLPPPGFPLSCSETPCDDNQQLLFAKGLTGDFAAEQTIASDGMGNFGNYHLSLWESASILLEIMDNNLDMLGQDALLDVFYDQASGHLVGQVQDARASMHHIDQLSPFTLQVLKDYAVERSNLLEEIEALDQLWADTEADSLLDLRLLLFEALSGLNSELMDIWESLDVLSLSRADSSDLAYINLSDLPQNYQWTEKHSSELYLKAIPFENENWTDADTDLLITEAGHCPAVFGRHVHRARSLYYHKFGYWPETAACKEIDKSVDLPGNPEKRTAISEFPFEISIRPNPVSNQLFISIRSEMVVEPSIRLLDAYGRALPGFAKANQVNNEFVLDVSSLSDGIYLLEINLPGQIAHIEKIVILH
ncbi:MAG: T9SS type A sorting domain-containing protein [Saprospiraceae bacterium]|nr:T9SS type A sorting domain-containing protein [Saprospiraceae bacterium]